MGGFEQRCDMIYFAFFQDSSAHCRETVLVCVLMPTRIAVQL